MPYFRARHLSLPIAIFAAAVAAGCSSVGVSGHAGYAFLDVGGGVGLDSAGAGVVEQGLESNFGVGGTQGSPYLRGQLDAGGTVLTGSAFWLSESGQGQLGDTFGGLPAGNVVVSELELGVAKISAAYDFEFGPVKLAPGVMCDVVAIDFRTTDAVSLPGVGLSESVDETLVVPMPFLRAELATIGSPIGAFRAVGELGYLEVSDIGGTGGSFFDFEAMVEYSPALLPFAHAFMGYRYVDLDGSGDTGGDPFSADLQLQGWTIGGGVRF